jgi:hypothetical protein
MDRSDEVETEIGESLIESYLAKLIELLPGIFKQKFNITVPFVKLQFLPFQNFLGDLLQIKIMLHQRIDEFQYSWCTESAWKAITVECRGGMVIV